MEVVKIIIYAISLLVAVISTFVPLYKSKKNVANGKQEEKSKNEMTDYLFECIEKAEKLYSGIDTLIKQQTGKGSGENKKDSVLAKMQVYATNNGYTFDVDYWSEKIDRIIALTNNVNKK